MFYSRLLEFISKIKLPFAIKILDFMRSVKKKKITKLVFNNLNEA